MEITIRVVCTDMPGSSFDDPRPGGVCYRNIRLALQRGEQIENAVNGDADRAIFEPRFTVKQQPDGAPNFLGPYAKGTPRERFFYLVWASENADGTLAMFRRAKIQLGHLSWSDVEAAAREERPITVEIAMTDGRGEPRCASIKAHQARWTV